MTLVPATKHGKEKAEKSSIERKSEIILAQAEDEVKEKYTYKRTWRIITYNDDNQINTRNEEVTVTIGRRIFDTKEEAFTVARKIASEDLQTLKKSIDSRATMSTRGFTIKLETKNSAPTRRGKPGSNDVRETVVDYEIIQL